MKKNCIRVQLASLRFTSSLIYIAKFLHWKITIIFMGINVLILLYLQTQWLYLMQNKHAGV